MRIAYLINQYPTVSHNFVRREILALERQGFEIMRIALRGWDRDLIHKEDELERKRTRYVLREGVMSLVVAVVYMLITRPVRLLQRCDWHGASAVVLNALSLFISSILPKPVGSNPGYARQASSICMRISAPTQPKLRCWCTRWAGRPGASPCMGPRNSRRLRSSDWQKRFGIVHS